MAGDNYNQNLEGDRGIYMTYAAFTTIAWLSCAEVFVKVFFVFKKWRGLYFWSILVTVFGIMMNSVGCLVHFYTDINEIAAASLVTVGWWGMVTGQSIVLYSWLHLLIRDKRKLRLILAIICTNAVLFHIPTSVLTLGAYATVDTAFGPAYSIMEKIQVTIFCLQEIALSLTYIFEVRKLIRQNKAVYNTPRAHRVFRHLIYINIFVIILDFAYVSCEYANIYYMQAGLKAAVYAYQLHLEFVILNQLMRIIGGANDDGQITNERDPNIVHHHHHHYRPSPKASHLPKGTPPSGSDPDMSPAKPYSVSVSKQENGTEKLDFDEGVTLTTELEVHSSNNVPQRADIPSTNDSNVRSGTGAAPRPSGRPPVEPLSQQPHAITTGLSQTNLKGSYLDDSKIC